MRTQVGFDSLAVCLLTCICPTDPVGLAGEERKPQTTIRAEEVGQTVKVLGRLGCPLHDVMTVRGTWLEPERVTAKPGIALRLRVTSVNGKRLDQPVEFDHYDVTVESKLGSEVNPVKDEQWELRAYETWAVRDHPQEYWQALGVAPPAPPPHGATRMFGVLKQRTAK